MNDQLLWFASRGAGIVSLILLTAVTVLGLMSVVRWQRPGWPRFLTADLHSNLALLSVIFVGVHIISAVIDPFAKLGVSAAVVPFASAYRPLWVGLGVISVYLVLSVVITSLLRERIGQRAWRAVHWVAYAGWPLGRAAQRRFGQRCLRAVDAGDPHRLRGCRQRRAAVARHGGTRQPLAAAGDCRRDADPGAICAARSMIDQPRLLAGPPAAAGAETLADQLTRLGPLPVRPDLIEALGACGLLGRGGAAFPVARKWHAVRQRGGDDARILVNGAEGEPLSAKDRTLLALRPQLVLDGALLAARAVGARQIVLYIGAPFVDAHLALRRALGERGRLPVRVRIVQAPDAYVAGEESAAIHYVNAGDARPTLTPPRPFESGVDGRPTLVQNVETLAHVALIARFGVDWYRQAGRGETRGTTLVTVSGAPQRGVREIELGTRIGEVAAASGLVGDRSDAVLLGGYFGRWVGRDSGWAMPLDPAALRAVGASLGSGVISFLPADQCGVSATAAVLEYMAAQSAAQCGPCVFGLRAIADTLTSLAGNRALPGDVERLQRWAGQVNGRGACAHPTGAVGLLSSGLTTFARDVAIHARRGGCAANVRTRAAA